MFEQCPKRLWLQTYRRGEAQRDDGAEGRFAAGHLVGDVACQLIPTGVMVLAEPDLQAALEETALLVAAHDPVPIFEATFAHDGVLVCVDVMEPDNAGGWHVAEVKSSASRKPYHLGDLATQIWVLQQAGVRVTSAAIRHIDRDFRLAREGDYQGLFEDAPTLVDIQPLIADRATVVAEARHVLAGAEPEHDVGAHCESPFPCDFQAYCNRGRILPDWPIELLPNTGRTLAAKFALEGKLELTDLVPSQLPNSVHRRIHEATRSGTPFHDPASAREMTAGWSYPRAYLDFETIAFPVPRWVGTGPWQQIPFQFSLHVEDGDGSLNHDEFLQLGGSDPRRACAEALIKSMPKEGAVIAYSAGFEKRCIADLALSFPDLAPALRAISTRVVDLLPVARACWYHRDQRGSWSIKAVLPTILGRDAYGDLPIGDGMAAQVAYLNALSLEAEDEIGAIADDLKAYCRLDTEAMVHVLCALTGGRTKAAAVQ